MKKDDIEAEAAEELRVEYGPEKPVAAGKNIAEPTVEEIKAKIAEKVRADGKERSAVTPSEVVFAIVPGSQPDRITAILEGMAADDRYADIKAVTTASGMVFFLSKTYFDTGEAIAKSRLEEVRFLLAEKVRADSKNDVALTSVSGLLSLAPEMDQDGVAAILDEMSTDLRYADIKSVTSPIGDVYYHSDKHMSGYYAVVLGRVAAKDPVATVAAMIRDESMIYPRPTCIGDFMEPMFNIPPDDLKAVFDELVRRPEYGDIKLMVHPKTGGVYAYSTRYLSGNTAYHMMDYEEVVKPSNP